MSVSIIIPHYKTELLAKLCLRSIRNYTNLDHEVIVVDNGSGSDPALSYLKQVKWIQLIEQFSCQGTPIELAVRSFDIGVAHATKPYILFLHTDCIPIHSDWLKWLLGSLQASSERYAVGSYKLELKTPFQIFLKRLESFVGLSKVAREGTHRNPFYIRSHCALYRREVFSELGLRYDTGGDCERDLHCAIQVAGYKACLLEPFEMLKYVVHLNHGTMVFNPEFNMRKRSIRKGKNRIEKFLLSKKVQAIYHNKGLDA
ncbi:MAG: glycosyltransferase family 2 protein [Gammaproteobacteria bacterium]|nr:glycosyltransferase family 2 protein [Gammaproteobacteria bacterium]